MECSYYLLEDLDDNSLYANTFDNISDFYITAINMGLINIESDCPDLKTICKKIKKISPSLKWQENNINWQREEQRKYIGKIKDVRLK